MKKKKKTYAKRHGQNIYGSAAKAQKNNENI